MKSWKKRFNEEFDHIAPPLREDVKNAPIVTATDIPMFCIGMAIAFFGTAALHVIFGFGEETVKDEIA